jgi:hypothetical protein
MACRAKQHGLLIFNSVLFFCLLCQWRKVLPPTMAKEKNQKKIFNSIKAGMPTAEWLVFQLF